MKNFFRSLQAKYMLIILLAIGLVQISFVGIAAILTGGPGNLEEERWDPNIIEEKWHEEANQLPSISAEEIKEHFAKWKQAFPEASMFWVDENGYLVEKMDVRETLPIQWTAAFTAKFIKDRYGGDPFTVIAFLGEEETNGFIVLEIPRVNFQSPMQTFYDRFGDVILFGTLFVILLFITISYLFFRNIRKRLLHLEQSMTARDKDGLPIQTAVKKKDEVGQLEKAFNDMVLELKESKKREQEEEQLRRELIANLSHDLRTPLTKISAQTYSLLKENLSPEGKQAVKTLQLSIRDIDRLIENLMSYTLLMASKYRLERKEVDVVRYVRESIASWYPVFEKEGFKVEVDLQLFENNHWLVDPAWLGRILDNVYQNVLRHAKSGKFIQVKTESTDQYDAFVIMDQGPGMKRESKEKGAGIGLSIVDMMVKGMELDWDITSSEHGTTIRIKKYK